MKKPNETKQLRSFGLLVGGIFALIGIWPRVWRGEPFRLWALVLAVLLIVPGIVYPRALTHIYRVWMAIGRGLGWVNSRIILTIAFFGLFTPVGLFMRLIGRDPLHRKFEPGVSTYRIPREARPGSHMKNQF